MSNSFRPPWTVAYQAPQSMEIFQARVLEWVAISFSRRIVPTQGSNLGLLHCRQMLYHLSHQGSQTQPKLPCLSLLFVPWGSPLLTYHPSHEGKDHHSHTTVKNLHSATRSLPSDSHLPIHWHFQVHPSVVASCPWTSNSTSVLLKTWSNTQRKPAYEMRSMVCMSALCL